MNHQKKNITKTILILIAVIAIILTLFFNKLLTARYLSEVELKINGLILLSSSELIRVNNKNAKWQLIANTNEQKEMLDNFSQSLRAKVKKSTEIVLAPIELQSQLNKALPDYANVISILNEKNELVGYLKPPFDEHKMLLTYSSVFTHR